MEQLIILVAIVLISAIHGWWKKRQGEAEAESEPWPGQPPRRDPGAPPAGRPPARPSPAASWEEELRRLLQGEQAPRPAPPPLAVPPPLPKAAPARPPLVPQLQPAPARPAPLRAPSLEQSAQAFLRASQLESRIAEHMHRVDQQVASHPKVEIKKTVPPEIRQAVSLVRNRQSQRAAIIAGIILGPPKAAEI